MSQPKDESGGESAGDNSTPAKNSVTAEEYLDIDLNDLIVETRDLTFTYDHKKGNLLNKINMSFPRSSIYGFLGPSGCGKTSLIKLIIGQLKPASGSIRVNGKPIKDPSNKIPGVGVGYMPQDYSLYMDLTILETMNYMSRIYGLPKDYMKTRVDFLIKFLELPDPNRLTAVLSGGQKRRTSLAIALIHNPKLLILDEPTVGVDPMLRERIWQHLVYLSTKEKTSIMITTHYIDECQRANVIALMRGGNMLVENTPPVLLKHFHTKNLEDVFLEVCKGEEQQTRPSFPPNLAEVKKLNLQKSKREKKKSITVPSFKSTFCGRYSALVIKTLTKLFRQKLFVFVCILTPLIATVMICTTFGKKPFNLRVAVFNEEKDQPLKFSISLIEKIDTHILNLEYHDSNSSAINSVKDGKTYGALVFHKNFTSALITRFASSDFFVSNETINLSTVYFFADTTDLMIYQAMIQTLRMAELEFRKEMIRKDPKANVDTIKPLIYFVEPPVYGTLDPEFRDFAAPAMMILAIYIISMAITSLEIVGERTEGTLDRTLVAGVKMLEILFGLITVQLIVVIIQTVGVLFLVLYVFEIKNEGNLVLIVLLLLMQGLQGMTCGLFVSIISWDELMALQVCVGIFLPYIIISGVVWPLEGMHYILRTVSLFTPQTLPILSLRNIMLKGWGLQHSLVWSGYISAFGFFVFFIILSLIVSSFITHRT